MRDLLDVLAELLDDGVSGRVHVVAPDLATLCRVSVVDLPRGDGIRFVVGRGLWKAVVTCPWCRSLGRAYWHEINGVLNGRPR